MRNEKAHLKPIFRYPARSVYQFATGASAFVNQARRRTKGARVGYDIVNRNSKYACVFMDVIVIIGKGRRLNQFVRIVGRGVSKSRLVRRRWDGSHG